MMEGNKQKILIVDDTPLNIKMLGEVLRNDYKIMVATHGEKALEIAASETAPDIILLDIMMPDMDGYEVCRRLKSDARTQGIPVIFISAKNEAVDEMRGLELGAVDYISKPFSMSIVVARIKTHLMLRKTMQTERDQREQLHAIIRYAMEGIIHVDAKGIIQSFNPEAEKIFGYAYDEVIGQNISILMPEPHRSRHDDYIKHYIETGKPQIIGSEREITTLRKNGSTFILSLVVNIMTLKGEVSFVVIARDITKRRQAEETVRKLSSCIEQAGESVVITNRQGIIEYINPAFTKVTGYSAEEAIGQTPRLLKSDNHNAAFYAAMWKTILDGKVWQGRVIDKKKDGGFYPVMLTISPIITNSSEITHFVGIQSDLSKLEDMESRFHQAQKMEAIGTMVGGIAHNFNNMLAGMTGNLYLAKQNVQEKPDVVQRLTNIEELSGHAAEMIQQLLAFARKGIVSMKEMPLTPFIKETLKLLCASVPENIAVHQDICSDNLQVKGDATQLHQVLANLVSNARDAVEGIDKPCITMRLESFYPDSVFLEQHTYFKACPYAHLSVKDNGYGIPQNKMEHMFEPFFTTKEQGKGTGLGLSMVYGALKTHHGFVEVTSKEGKGSTFHIYIPLQKAKEVAAEPIQQKQTVKGGGEVLLLADDEPVVRGVMAEILESMGYKILQASDGLETMEVFKAHEQDIALALLDVVMPHCGGMPLAKQLRAVNPNVPVLFLTGYDKEHVLHGDEAMPNSEVLTKPVNFDDLSHCIRLMLG